MSSSPRTPNRRRKSSNLDQPFSSLRSIQSSPTGKRSSGKFSIHSIPSSTSFKSPSLRDDSLSFTAPDGLESVNGDSNGLGNLADELAGAWDDEGAQAPQMEDTVAENGENILANGDDGDRGRPTLEIHHDMNIVMPKMSYHGANDSRSLSPPKKTMRSRPRRKTSNVSDYDGSDYGAESDLETVEGISASLEHRLAAIESLARRGIESNGSEADRIAMRVAESLQDLGSQVGVETGATRLMTAQTAVASNLAHQTRLVQTLSRHLVSPFSIPPAPEEMDQLLPLLVTTLELLPPPNPRAITSLHSLHSSAVELLATLATLADSLHMLRQTTSLAARKLKAAKDVVDEFRKEADLREEGIRWVEEGNWDAKLSNRECAAACGDVVSGFRDVCEKWEVTIRENAVGNYALEVAAG
ncbi:MAG: hypothetical protein LQ338_007394 [Usnochroma carphineum]|nr:MAG: hypothetical protein LQ338_007394 [Usnochroma carphineum]